MMVIISQNDMPADCVKCHEMGLRDIANCELVYAGCANCGRHPHCPLKSVEGLIEKIMNTADEAFDKARIDAEQYEIIEKTVEIIKEYCTLKEGD